MSLPVLDKKPDSQRLWSVFWTIWARSALERWWELKKIPKYLHKEEYPTWVHDARTVFLHQYVQELIISIRVYCDWLFYTNLSNVTFFILPSCFLIYTLSFYRFFLIWSTHLLIPSSFPSFSTHCYTRKIFLLQYFNPRQP